MTESATGKSVDSAEPVQKPKHTVVEVVASSIEEGVEAGASAMGVDTSVVQAEVIEEKPGFMGMGKPKIRMRVRYEPPKAEPKKVNVDGRFLVGYRNGAFHLLVTKPRGDGSKVDLADVERVLRGLPLPEEAQEMWESAVAESSGLAVNLLTGYAAEEFLDEDEPVDVDVGPEAESDGESSTTTEADDAGDADEEGLGETDVGSAAVIISQDRMMAWIASRTLSFRDALTADDAKMAIHEAGVTHGMNDALIERVVGKPLLRPVQFAQGVDPTFSIDGKFEFKEKFSEEELSQLLPDASEGDSPREGGESAEAPEEHTEPIDWFEQFSKETVESGEILAEEVPPVPGSSGTNVLGEEVPVEDGLTVDLSGLAGQNTEVVDGKLVASMGGEPGVVDGKLEIHELTGFPKDIDFSTGNVRFPGSVHVRGNIRPGFVVSARDNVEIGGRVEAGIVSAAGSIVVGGGFLGDADGRTGSLMAGRDLAVKFIEGGSIAVGGDMQIGGDIVRGDVAVLGKIKLEGGGRIIGGRVSAGVEVQAKIIGSRNGARTVVSVANPSTEKTTVKRLVEARALATMTDEEENGDDTAEESADVTADDSEPTGDSGDDSSNQQDESGSEKSLGEPRILVRDAIYPGAVVGIGNSVRLIDTRIDHCILREVNDEIKIFPL